MTTKSLNHSIVSPHKDEKEENEHHETDTIRVSFCAGRQAMPARKLSWKYSLKSVRRIDFFANFAHEFTREVFQNGKLCCDKQKI